MEPNSVKIGERWDCPTDEMFCLQLKTGSYGDCHFVQEADGVLTFDYRELGRWLRVQVLVDDILILTRVPPPGH